MPVDSRKLDFLAKNHRAVIATLAGDGRPHLSNIFYAYDRDADLVRISMTTDRVKIRHLQADPRVTLHVASSDFWTWVAVEGIAELSPIAADPHDATVDELVTYFRQVNGEHPDWDEFRAAMVAERRIVARFRPQRAYGQLPG